MKTAGQILSSSRLSQKLELSDVAKTTKIRQAFLEFIESDDYSRLPSGATTRGFIRNYSEFLKLNPEHVLAVFRRDLVENPQGQIVPRSVADPVIKKNFWTPKTTIFSFVVLVFVIFGAYLIYQYRILTGPPPLEIKQPPDNVVISESTVDIEGLTDPEATISVNSQLVALEKGGVFTFKYPLSIGDNTIVITATSKSGKTSTINRTIKRTGPNVVE